MSTQPTPVRITVYDKPVEITSETILKTREHFAKNSEECIEDATAGVFRVNDLDKFIEWQRQMAEDYRAGRVDHTLTFIQRALWIQTGESVPLLT